MDKNLNKFINLLISISFLSQKKRINNTCFSIVDGVDELIKDIENKSKNILIIDSSFKNSILLIADYSNIDDIVYEYLKLKRIKNEKVDKIKYDIQLLRPILKRGNSTFHLISVENELVEIHFINSDLDIGFDYNEQYKKYNFNYRKLSTDLKKRVILFNKIIFQSRLLNKREKNESSTYSFFMTSIYICNLLRASNDNVFELVNYLRWFSDYKLSLNELNSEDMDYIAKFIISKVISEEDILNKDILFYKKLYEGFNLESIKIKKGYFD